MKIPFQEGEPVKNVNRPPAGKNIKMTHFEKNLRTIKYKQKRPVRSNTGLFDVMLQNFYSGDIQSTGHTSEHDPQSVHLSGSIL